MGAGNEHIARQELNALNVKSRKLCAISVICGAKQRPPEGRVIGPAGAKIRVDVLCDRVDGGDRKRDQEFGD